MYKRQLIKLFDESDEVFEFISCMTAIEALLGDEKPRASMTELLADRVSYLLGNTSETRQELKESFIDLYDYRSKILHGRTSMIGDKHHELQSALRNLTKDIFTKEFDNYLQ